MYTVKKIETPDRGEQFAVVIGENIINRWLNEEDAKENCTQLNGGEVAEKKLAAAEKKAEEDAKKVADEQAKAAKTSARKEHTDDHKPRTQPAKAKVHFVKRMAPKLAPKPTRRHK